MATSGVYVVTKTAAQIVKAALRPIKAIASGAEPSGSEMEDAIELLNDILLQLQTEATMYNAGLKLWMRERASMALTAKNNFSLKPSGGDLNVQIPLEILSIVRRDTDSNDTVLDVMNTDEYQALSNKTDVGTPTQYLYEKRLTEGVLYLDYIPEDITDTLQILYRQPLELITAQTQEVDIEPYLYRAIRLKLTVELWSDYKEGEIPNTIVMLAQEAMGIAQTFYPNSTINYFLPGVDL